MKDNNSAPVGNGDIVQLMPTCVNPDFAGTLMVVTETRSWGVIGYVHVLGHDGKEGSLAFYRAGWAEIVDTGGKAVFIPGDIISDILEDQKETESDE